MISTASTASHYLQVCAIGTPCVIGVSTWDMRDGGRLRREMRRVTYLTSQAAVRKWAKKYSDIRAQDLENALAVFLP